MQSFELSHCRKKKLVINYKTGLEMHNMLIKLSRKIYPRIKSSRLIEIFESLLIVLFVYAAINKLIDIQKFQIELGKSPIINSFSKLASVGVPVLELIIASMFFFNKSKLSGFYLAFGLMVSFTAYIIIILNFSDYIPCSCGGVISMMSWNQHLLFNIFFILISALGVMLYPKKILSADRGENRKP